MRGILVGLGLMGLFGCTTAAAGTVAGGSGGAGGDATSSAVSGGGGSGPATEGPYVPSLEPEGTLACADDSSCVDDPDEFELLYETPASIELLDATTNAALGYDHEAKRFVLYSVMLADYKTTALPTVSEAGRFGPEVDRVTLHQDGLALVCAGASCEVWYAHEGGEFKASIPNELEAKSVWRGCVAGRGIVCPEGSPSGDVWRWKLGPEVLSRPITTFAFLGGEMFIASDGVGPAMLIDQGHVFPLDLETTSPIVTLVAVGYGSQYWSGLTASNQLIVGNAGGGIACGSNVRIVDTTYFTGRSSVSGDTLTYGGAVCHHAALPEGIIDVSTTQCGVETQRMAISAHGVYGREMGCAYD